MIMIDPKMLELSTYDGIPHLLTPVVTDPKQAVIALKWTVREMEDRYRKMSKLGVRNIDGYNQRGSPRPGQKGETLIADGADRLRPRYRRGDLRAGGAVARADAVHRRHHRRDGRPDDGRRQGHRGAVQRLAQMARAAGIHVVMATQRPSVDVITGTIKANFPTRISFQVTSKIDSRTILGEQGAEQLLGQGDMLLHAGGGRIQRVHGPFVSEQRGRGGRRPSQAAGHAGISRRDHRRRRRDRRLQLRGDAPPATTSSSDLYDRRRRSCSATARSRPATSSAGWPIGYNRAASIIERMEKDGLVGPANHAGKREILVGEDEEVGFR